MKHDLISIVIPVYNVEPYLKRCLDSVLGQTYQNIQILLIDDGSTDKGGSICDEYAAGDNRVSVVHQNNQGLSMARNRGIRMALGKYIMFVDSDDWISPDAVSYLLEGTERYEADIAVCGWIITNGIKHKKMAISAEKLLRTQEAVYELVCDRLMKNYACAKLFRTALFEDISYPANQKFEDIPTTFRLYQKAGRIAWLPEAKYYYFSRSDSISSSPALDGCMDRCMGHQYRIENIEKAGNRLLDELMVQYYYAYRLFQLQLLKEKPEISKEEALRIQKLNDFFAIKAPIILGNPKILMMEKREIQYFKNHSMPGRRLKVYEILRKAEKFLKKQIRRNRVDG